MKNKTILIGAGVIGALALGYYLWDKKRDNKSIQDAKDKELADASKGQQPEPLVKPAVEPNTPIKQILPGDMPPPAPPVKDFNDPIYTVEPMYPIKPVYEPVVEEVYYPMPIVKPIKPIYVRDEIYPIDGFYRDTISMQTM